MRILLLAALLYLTAAATSSPLSAQSPAVQETARSEGSTQAAKGDEQDDESPSLKYHDTVVVTASRTEESILDTPVSMTVVLPEQVATTPAANMADLLRGVPGLNVIQLSARDVSITGRAPTGVFTQGQLTLVDGRVILDEPNGITFWDTLPVTFDEVKQVEILHGPGSAIWGGNALSAVVNLRLKTPRELAGGLATLGAGENGTRMGSLRWAGANETLGYKLSSSYFQQDAWERPKTLPDGSPVPPLLAYRNVRTRQPKLDLRLDWEPDENRRWSWRAGLAKSTGVLLTTQVPVEFTSGNYSAYADMSYTTPRVEAHLYWHRNKAGARNLLDGSPLPARRDAPIADVTARRALGSKHVLVFGGSSRLELWEHPLLPDTGSRIDFGGFAEDHVFLTPKLHLRLGGRLDHLPTAGLAASPRASVLFKPTPRHSLRLGYSRAYRPPTIIENYVKVDTGFSIDLGPLGPFVVKNLAVGNRELDVVRSDGFELGYTGVLRGAHTFSATVYNIRIRDGIYGGIAEFYGPGDPPPGWPLPSAFVPPFALPKLLTFRNVGTIRNRGFESSLNSGWGASFWTVLAYTWQDRPRLGDTNPLFPVTLNLPSRHQASATVGGTHGRWKGSAGLTYTSRAFWADVFDPRFWGYTGSYLLANATIEHAFPVWRLEGVLRATDLFDRKVQQHAFGDIIRRRATLEVRKRF